MILSEESPEVKAYIQWQLGRLHLYGINVFASPYRAVVIGDRQVKGYFHDQEQRLAYAAGLPFQEWFPVFVHESCHFDQWVDKAAVWKSRIGSMKPQNVIDLWLSHHVEMNLSQQLDAFHFAVEYELDCEKRTIAKYQQHNIPIDADRMIQRANAGLYFYQHARTTRQWYQVQPRTVEALVDAMPTHFDNDYQLLPVEYIPLLQQCYNPITKR